MKKLILLLILVLPLISNSQSNDFNKSQKRNEQFFRNRTFWVPTYYPRFYPNYYWYTSPYIGPTPYYYTPSTSSVDLDVNFSVGLNLPILLNEPLAGFGVYMTFGKDIVFVTSFDMLDMNSYIYYPNISYRDVLSWGDRYSGKEIESYLINFGLGKRFKNFVPYVAFYIYSATEYSVYFDNSYILSSSGYYTIYNGQETKLGPALGTLYDINKFQLNFLYNPQRNIISIGGGIKL